MNKPSPGSTRADLFYFSNEFARQDLEDGFRRLHHRSKDARYHLLAAFLIESTRAVKEEAKQLSPELRRLIPPFQSVLDLVSTPLREGQLCGAFEGVFLILQQIGTYISYVEDNGHVIDPSTAVVAGLGVGLLSSTTIALSPKVSDLPLAGANAIRLAFRMGVHVQGVSGNLESRDLSESPDSWAYVISGVDPATAQDELDAVNSNSSSDISKIFISAVSPTSVTISGPPSRLKAIMHKSDFFRDSKSIVLPVYGGLCHAPHIYSSRDVYTIFDQHSEIASNLPQCRPGIVYSTSTGRPYEAHSQIDLYISVISELLTQAICWDRVVTGICEVINQDRVSSVEICCFGNSLPLRDLEKALKDQAQEPTVSLNDLSTSLFQSPPTPTYTSPANAKLAIVGMSCRLPGAKSNEEFWQLLEQGVDVSRRIPADRFDIDTHYDPSGKDLNKSMTQYGCFIEEPGLFDAPFFNMSPREAQAVDPQMRLALVTAFEALEQSGYVGNRTPSTQSQRVGTFYGQAADDYREVNQGQEVGTYYIPGGCRAFGPGRINYFFKFAGPSYSIDTACSSGLASIEVACQALWNDSIDMAVAGGLNVLTNPDGFAGLCNGHFLTKTHNACKTWDATADGYCRADGIGSLVIKRLADAEADNDNILGVILAAGTNHSAEAVSITHPHAGHQAYLSRQVLRQAAVDPMHVSYVELHGTGTQAGDFQEVQGVLDVYAPTKGRKKDQPLYIGSVKANVGHGESVAGTTSLIKVLMMLQKNAIPPHIGITTEINPKFPKDFDQRNLHIALSPTEWPSVNGKKRIAAVNNFGAAGGNTMMILEDAPTRSARSLDSPGARNHVVTVSAKTRASLTANIQNLIAYLESNPRIELADLSYTTTARRYHYNYRMAFSSADVASLKQRLSSAVDKVSSLQPVNKSPRPVAFVFTGQGASYKSMDIDLYRHSATFRTQIDHLDSLARAHNFPSIIPVLDGSHPNDYAHTPLATQLALVCTEIALAKYFETSLGIQANVVVGHSLGEFAALHIAGVISASDAILMVGRRAQMLQEKCQVGSHTMVAINATLSQLTEVLGDKPYKYNIACVNTPTDTVLSGTREEMDKIVAAFNQVSGYRCAQLDVAFAFHSDQLDPIVEDFEAACDSVVFKEPKLPVISPLLGKVIFDGRTLNANYLRRASRETVDFVSAIQNAQEISTISSDTVWVEVGPHPVCCGFLKSILGRDQTIAVPSMRRGVNNWTTLSDSLAELHNAGVTPDFNEFHVPFEKDLRLLGNLPSYAWDEKNYWLQYNGDWCLTKGNTFYDTPNKTVATVAHTGAETSTVQHFLDVQINGNAGAVVIQSDLMQKQFLAAANGHRMNNCGVVTSSIHADIAYTLGHYLYRQMRPNAREPGLNVANLSVSAGLIAQNDTSSPQLIQVTASTEDIDSGILQVTWHNVNSSGEVVHEPFVTADVFVDDTSQWLAAWAPMAHLVHGRIEALSNMATLGQASRFSGNMAYTLFAKNLVNYSSKYRGMKSVVMHEFEAFADVQLVTEDNSGGIWTVPPHFIDSVAHLAGFVMNCTDAIDTENNYCVTPGWNSMRFAEPLVPGALYRSYVKMLPTVEDPSTYFGDVYIMRRGDYAIVGMVGGIQFRRYPRILLDRFFSPPDKASTRKTAKTDVKAQLPAAPVTAAVQPAATKTKATKHSTARSGALAMNLPHARPGPTKPVEEPAVQEKIEPVTTDDTGSSSASDAISLIANEAGLDVGELTNDTNFGDIGVDSLMSLVIAEKMRSDLDINVGGSLFLDYPTVGDLRAWLDGQGR